MVTSQGNQTRQCLPFLRRPGLISMGMGCATQKEVMTILDLPERIRIVVPIQTCQRSSLTTLPPAQRVLLRSNRNIPAINHLRP